MRPIMDALRSRALFEGMKLRVPVPLLLLFLLGMVMIPASSAADFGTKVVFKKNAPVAFADFVLTYLGERRVASDRFPVGFLYHDFHVASAAGTQTVSWSSGTGDIGPALFRVGSSKFALELSRSDKLGRLKPNELVISRAPQASPYSRLRPPMSSGNR